MPELPEVETIVRDLKRLVRGATIAEVQVVRPDLVTLDPIRFSEVLHGARIDRVERRAKNILLHLSGTGPEIEWLKVNLGMTGRLLVQGADAPEPKHLGVRFVLGDGRRLLYEDIRRFGELSLLSADAWREQEARLGLEPLSDEFTAEALLELMRRSRSPIKVWLMDQKRVVGIGNIYASEALFHARIRPTKPAHDLSAAAAARLHEGIQAVLNQAIEFRGTTLLDYRDAAGERGSFAARLCVYGREGQPCVRDGTPIRKIVQAGRSTFFCPHCQR